MHTWRFRSRAMTRFTCRERRVHGGSSRSSVRMETAVCHLNAVLYLLSSCPMVCCSCLSALHPRGTERRTLAREGLQLWTSWSTATMDTQGLVSACMLPYMRCRSIGFPRVGARTGNNALGRYSRPLQPPTCLSASGCVSPPACSPQLTVVSLERSTQHAPPLNCPLPCPH